MADELLTRIGCTLAGDGAFPDDDARIEAVLAAGVITSVEQRWQYVGLLCIDAARRATDGLGAEVFGDTPDEIFAQALASNHKINAALDLMLYRREAGANGPMPDIRLPARRWNVPGTDRWVDADTLRAELREILRQARALPDNIRRSWAEKAFLARFKAINDRLKDAALWRLMQHASALSGMQWRRLTKDTRADAIHVRLHFATAFLTASLRVGRHTIRRTRFLPAIMSRMVTEQERPFMDSHVGARGLGVAAYQLLFGIYSGRSEDELIPVLGSLYDLLLRDLLDRPKVQDAIAALGPTPTLVIATHGPLAQIPFAALHDGRGYLAERFDIVQAPPHYGGGELDAAAIDWEAMTGGSPVTQPPPLRLLADTIGLRKAQDEIASHAALRATHGLPGGERGADDDRPWTSEDLRWLLEGPGVAVLSSHLVTRSEEAAAAAIRLPSGGELPVVSAIDRRLSADLLVLAACTSQAQTDWFAAGENSLVSLLRRRGVGAVVSTLWPVKDLAASRYNAALLDGLIAGRSRAAAHGEALRRLMRSEATLAEALFDERLVRTAAAPESAPQAVERLSLRHPKIWAPFVLSGAWR